MSLGPLLAFASPSTPPIEDPFAKAVSPLTAVGASSSSGPAQLASTQASPSDDGAPDDGGSRAQALRETGHRLLENAAYALAAEHEAPMPAPEGPPLSPLATALLGVAGATSNAANRDFSGTELLSQVHDDLSDAARQRLSEALDARADRLEAASDAFDRAKEMAQPYFDQADAIDQARVDSRARAEDQAGRERMQDLKNEGSSQVADARSANALAQVDAKKALIPSAIAKNQAETRLATAKANQLATRPVGAVDPHQQIRDHIAHLRASAKALKTPSSAELADRRRIALNVAAGLPRAEADAYLRAKYGSGL